MGSPYDCPDDLKSTDFTLPYLYHISRLPVKKNLRTVEMPGCCSNVDSVAVAEDAQSDMEGSFNGLYIGCGKNMEAGAYWSGLIDDVRVYNRAVRP